MMKEERVDEFSYIWNNVKAFRDMYINRDKDNESIEKENIAITYEADEVEETCVEESCRRLTKKDRIEETK